MTASPAPVSYPLSYKDTLNLLQTPFAMRANAKVREPEIQAFWAQQRLYERLSEQNPGKVFTREMLLSRVWGYEYYGGARTVDVHVRRLRAKLGEEHANLIQTVRSVGYRFGQSRWDS